MDDKPSQTNDAPPTTLITPEVNEKPTVTIPIPTPDEQQMTGELCRLAESIDGMVSNMDMLKARVTMQSEAMTEVMNGMTKILNHMQEIEKKKKAGNF